MKKLHIIFALLTFVGIVLLACSTSGSGANCDEGECPSSSSIASNPALSSSGGGSVTPPGLSSTGTVTVSSSSVAADSYPPLQAGGSGVKSGHATRYWDGCKPSCTWPKDDNITNVCKNCNKENQEVRAYFWHNEWNKYHSDQSSCESGGTTYTCFDMAPIKVTETLAYGYAASAGAEGYVCGKCYQLQFDGKGKYDTKPAHQRLNNKTMIVMASNIGYDVSSNHLDILIPGGGVGQFDSFSNQLGINKSQLGAEYGGFLTTCQSELGYDADHRSCVRQKCQSVFGSNAKFADLLRGCEWFVDWFEAADNPTFIYKEVECPDYLKNKYKPSVF